MVPNTLQTMLFSSLAVFYFLAALALLFWPSYRRKFTRLIVAYLMAVGAWQLGLIQPVIAVQERLVTYGFLLLAFYLVYLTYGFLIIEERRDRPWWAVGLIIIAVLVILDLLLPAPTNPFLWQTLHPVWLLALLAGWSVLISRTAVITLQAHRNTDRRPLHRNRIRYWVLIILFSAMADVAALTNALLLSTILRFVAAILAAYASLTYRLIDIRYIIDRTTSQLLAAIIVGLVYGLGFVYIWRANTGGMSPILAGAGLTMLLVLFFQPLQKGLQQIVEYFSAENDYDPNRILREYSVIISNIMDLSELEATAVRLVSEAMEISYGTLFLVDSDEDLVGRPVFELVSVQGFGVDKLVLGAFSANSPVANYLSTERRPLTQYDIDWQPQFQEIAQLEREWLAGLGVEVFVPIYAQERWIGLLGLGPKVARTRYYDHDLLLLSTLADQTAVALENARLVADLTRITHDLQQAYADLEQANHQLQESDQLKSDFIGVITHEMRTPFANVGFALQLLENEGLDKLTPDQQEEFLKVKAGIKQAREMIDNLINFAAFVNKQRRLNRTEFDFRELVLEVIQPLQPLIANKNLQVQVNGSSHALHVSGDRDRLIDAIHHLVHNAIKFTPENGQITVCAWKEANGISFSVEDTGPGIPPDRLNQLWEGFNQLADPLRRGVEGIGLGLTIVKSVAVAHGGEVFSHSTESVGSTFGFTLPIS